LWQVVGQSRVVSLLQRSLERGSIAHAYLVVGPPHVGKMTLARCVRFLPEDSLGQARRCPGYRIGL
jgi:DNA polymerase III delta prime subunit